MDLASAGIRSGDWQNLLTVSTAFVGHHLIPGNSWIAGLSTPAWQGLVAQPLAQGVRQVAARQRATRPARCFRQGLTSTPAGLVGQGRHRLRRPARQRWEQQRQRVAHFNSLTPSTGPERRWSFERLASCKDRLGASFGRQASARQTLGQRSPVGKWHRILCCATCFLSMTPWIDVSLATCMCPPCRDSRWPKDDSKWLMPRTGWWWWWWWANLHDRWKLPRRGQGGWGARGARRFSFFFAGDSQRVCPNSQPSTSALGKSCKGCMMLEWLRFSWVDKLW